ncbi:hypothetical protein IWW50_006156, partial [Coemansia erecta]
KGWDVGRPARIFCIEEPFSTWLNLAHSANATAVEGIRQEFQRAFRILRDGGSYDQVCEVYQRPVVMDIAPPMSAPVRPRSEYVLSSSISAYDGYSATQSSMSVHGDYSAMPGMSYPTTPSLSTSSTMVEPEFSSSYSPGLVRSAIGAYHSTTTPPPRTSRRESYDSGIHYGSVSGRARQWYMAPSHVADQRAFGHAAGRGKLSELDEQLALGSQFARMSVASFTSN